MGQTKATFTIKVNAAANNPVLTPNGGALGEAAVGVAVDETVTVVSGGTPPYSFAVTAGAVPDGLALNSVVNPDGTETVTIDGTPTTAGDASFELTVTDAAGATAKASVKKSIA